MSLQKPLKLKYKQGAECMSILGVIDESDGLAKSVEKLTTPSDTDKMEWGEFIYKIYRVGIADGIDIQRGDNDRFFGNKGARAKWEEKWVEEWFLELNSELQKAADSARVKVVGEITKEAHKVITVWDLKDFYKYLDKLTDTNTKEGK